MTAKRHDFNIEKGAMLYQVFQTFSADNERSLVGKQIKCIIKESISTATILHELTESNGGIIVVDDTLGKFAMYIPADETFIDVSRAVYEVVEVDEANTDYNRRLMNGKITYIDGAQNG